MNTMTELAENWLEMIRVAQGLQPKSIERNGVRTAIVRDESEPPFIQEIVVKVG